MGGRVISKIIEKSPQSQLINDVLLLIHARDPLSKKTDIYCHVILDINM